MVSFVCEACNDVIKKPKLQQHYQRCYAPFTCIDCNKTFPLGEFQKHSSCISEAQKYEKTVWKGDKPTKGQKGKQQQQQRRQQQKPQQNQNQSNGHGHANKVESVPEAPAAASVEEASTSTVNGTTTSEPLKKERKDRKRRCSEVDATEELGVNVIAQETVQEADKSTADGEDSKADKKKKKKKTKQKEAKYNDLGQTRDHTAEPKPSLESILTQSLTAEGASVSLKEILEKAGGDVSVLGSLKVSQGKKGKYILSVA